jgi:uncharacterized membrane protein YedE/YeeE
LLGTLLALLLGVALGVVVHRGAFCMHSGFKQALARERSSSFRSYLLALGLQLLFVNLLFHFGYLTIRLPAFSALAALTGGFLFGLGMIWARG